MQKENNLQISLDPLLFDRLKKVLVIDDSEHWQKVIAQALFRSGQTNLAVFRRVEDVALAGIQPDHCGLIVVDHFLDSGLTGFDYFVRLRGNGCNVPFILASGNPDSARAALEHEREFPLFIEKPFALSDFKELIALSRFTNRAG